MINKKVIKEIYKKYRRPEKNQENLRLDYFQQLLAESNPFKIDDDMIVLEQVDEYSPFKRFLIRSLHGVIEFDRTVAFVFASHIIFLNKNDVGINFYLHEEDEPKGLMRLFRRRK